VGRAGRQDWLRFSKSGEGKPDDRALQKGEESRLKEYASYVKIFQKGDPPIALRGKGINERVYFTKRDERLRRRLVKISGGEKSERPAYGNVKETIVKKAC